jgi:hypothetical protein
MERTQLERLTVKDLKYYTKSRRITSPINATKRDLVDIILGNQAKRLSEMARTALAQVQGGEALGRDFQTVDLTRLEPHTSAYSSQAGSSVDRDMSGDSGRTGLSGATGGGRAREEEDGAALNSSKRLKKVSIHPPLPVYSQHNSKLSVM